MNERKFSQTQYTWQFEYKRIEKILRETQKYKKRKKNCWIRNATIMQNTTGSTMKNSTAHIFSIFLTIFPYFKPVICILCFDFSCMMIINMLHCRKQFDLQKTPANFMCEYTRMVHIKVVKFLLKKPMYVTDQETHTRINLNTDY